MTNFYASYPVLGGGSGIATYATFADFPASAPNGTVAIALDTLVMYVYSTTNSAWEAVAEPGDALAIGTIDSVSPSVNGVSLSVNNLIMQSASTSYPGVVNNTAQSFSGAKTFTNGLISTTVNVTSLTASTALVSDSSKNIVSSSTTATEIGYVHGVTSSIQTQLNSLTGNGFTYVDTNQSVYGGTNSTLTFTSYGNAIVGVGSGTALTSGNTNTIFGTQCGYNLTTGSSNTVVGASSLKLCVTGSNNVALGTNALTNATSSQNTATNCLGSVTTGGNNTGYGFLAGNALTTGANHTLIGMDAGHALVSVNSCVMLGYNAGYNGVTANTFYVGNVRQSSEANDESYSLLYGTFSGTAASLTNQQLTVNGGFTVNGTITGNQVFQYLESNSSVYGGTHSTLTFTGADNTVVGSSAGGELTTGSNNTLLGASANCSDTPSDCVVIGSDAIVYNLFAATSGGHVIIGSQATLQPNSGTDTPTIGIGVTVQSAFGDILLGPIGGNGNSFAAGAAPYSDISGNYPSYTITGGPANSISFGSPYIAYKDLYLGNGGAALEATGAAVTIQPTPQSGGSNVAGSNITLLGGQSTGNAAGGEILFQTCSAGSSGTSSNSYKTAGYFDSSQNLNLNAALIVGPLSGASTAIGVGVCGANLTGTVQQLFLGGGNISGKSFGTGANAPTAGAEVFRSVVAQPAGSDTYALLLHFTKTATSMGAGNTVTREIDFRTTGPSLTATISNYATLADNTTFTGNYFLNSTSTNPSVFSGPMTLGSTSSQQHTLNTKTATGSATATLGTTGPGGTTPAGWIEITINGATQYIPYF